MLTAKPLNSPASPPLPPRTVEATAVAELPLAEPSSTAKKPQTVELSAIAKTPITAKISFSAAARLRPSLRCAPASAALASETFKTGHESLASVCLANTWTSKTACLAEYVFAKRYSLDTSPPFRISTLLIAKSFTMATVESTEPWVASLQSANNSTVSKAWCALIPRVTLLLLLQPTLWFY